MHVNEIKYTNKIQNTKSYKTKNKNKIEKKSQNKFLGKLWRYNKNIKFKIKLLQKRKNAFMSSPLLGKSFFFLVFIFFLFNLWVSFFFQNFVSFFMKKFLVSSMAAKYFIFNTNHGLYIDYFRSNNESHTALWVLHTNEFKI